MFSNFTDILIEELFEFGRGFLHVLQEFLVHFIHQFIDGPPLVIGKVQIFKRPDENLIRWGRTLGIHETLDPAFKEKTGSRHPHEHAKGKYQKNA